MPRKGTPKLVVTQQSDSGRNEHFKNTQTGQDKTRAQTLKDIKAGKLLGYHIRVINGVETPVSNPDNSENNNLG